MQFRSRFLMRAAGLNHRHPTRLGASGNKIAHHATRDHRGKLVLSHRLGGWDNAFEVVGVTGKSKVSDVRNEIKTSGYSLLNLRASYAWQQVRLDVGVDNLLNRMYYHPQGGAYLGQGMTMAGTAVPWGVSVPGMGRSLSVGLTVKF